MRIKKLVYGTMKSSKTGGGFMNQYNIIVQQLLAYLTKRKQCSSSWLSHKHCYEEFVQYLKENNLYLSQDTDSGNTSKNPELYHRMSGSDKKGHLVWSQ